MLEGTVCRMHKLTSPSGPAVKYINFGMLRDNNYVEPRKYKSLESTIMEKGWG